MSYKPIALIVLISSLVFVASASATTTLSGKTNQGQPISFTVSSQGVTNFRVIVADTCPDGHTLLVRLGGYPPLSVTNGTFGGQFAPVGGAPGEQSTIAGAVKGTTVSGTIKSTGHSAQENALCNGSASWTLKLGNVLPTIPTFLGAARLKVKPGRITYTGDGTGFFAGFGRASHRPYVGRLRWSKWTASQAIGSGADWLDNCMPDCAQGLRSAYRVRLTADRPALLGGYVAFSRLRVTYTHSRAPGHHKRTFTMLLHYQQSGNSFYWSIPGSV